MKTRSSRRARGYTLVALTIGITVMLILMAAALPLASTQMQRGREEELIFRGRQFAEGIRCFQKKYGRYPTTLKEMLDARPRTLRKLWKDPITNSTDWGLITVGSLSPVPGLPGTSGPTGSTDGGSFGGTFGGGFGGKGSPTPVPVPTPTPDPWVFGGSPRPGPGGGGSTSGGGSPFDKPGGDAPLMPIMGVFSKSTKKSIRTWQGRDTYADWKFTVASLALDSHGEGGALPGVVPGPGIPGGPVPPPPGGGGPKNP